MNDSLAAAGGVMLHDEGSFIDSIEKLEESQQHIAELLAKLEFSSNEEVEEVSFLIGSMDSLLDHYTDNHLELQMEMRNILESSRNGLLTHDKLSEMVQGEQSRSNFLVNIIGSLKVLLDRLFKNFNKLMEDNDLYLGESGDLVMKNMNLVMKSMDSITKVVVAPSKKLDTTIKKIDSELLIHLNNSIYLSMDPKKSMQLKDTGNSAADRQHNNRMKQKNPFASQSPINLDSRRTVRKLHEGLTPKGRESHVKGFHLDKIVGEEIGGKVGTPVAQSPTKKASVPLRVEVSPSNSDDSSSSGDEQGSKKSKKRGKRKKKKGKKTKKSRKSKSKKKKDGDEYESDDDSDDSSYVGYGIGSLDGSNSLVSNDSSAVFDSDSRDASNSTKKRKKVKKRGKKKVGKSQMSDSVSTLGDDNDDDKSYNYSTGVQSKNNNLHRKSLGIASDNIDDIDNVNDFDDIKKKRRAKLQARKTMIGQETGQEEVSEQADEGGAEEMSNKKEKTAALDGIDVALAGMSEYDRKYYKNMMHRIMLKENLLDKKIALAEMEISRKVREIIYGPAAVAHLEVREGVVIDPVPIDEIEKFRREQLASGHNQFGRNNSGRFLPSIDGSSPMQNRTRSFLQLIRSNDENDEEIINSMMETQMNAETLAEKKRNKMMLNSNDKERLLKHQSILNEVMSNIKAFKRSKAEGKLNENSKWNLIKIYAPQLDKRKNVGTSTDDLESSPIDKFPPLSTINTGILNTNTDKMAMQGTSKGVIYAKNASKNNDDHENRGVGYTDSLSDAGDLTPRIPVNGRAPFTLSTKKRDKYELPIIDNRDNILITRTYKELPKNKTFQKILEESDNPLYEIYDYYGHLLNNTTKAKLLNCAATIHRIDDQIKSSNTYHKVLWSLLENILLVQSECDFMLNNVDIIEKIVSALLSMKDAGNSIDSKTIKAAIEDLNIKMGEAEAIKLLTDLKLVEYRTIFETVNAQGLHQLKHLAHESREFEQCLKQFQTCQGKSVEIHQRLEQCRDRCKRHNILDLLRVDPSGMQKSIKIRSESAVLQESVLQSAAIEIESLKNEIAKLNEQIVVLQEDYADLEVEAFEALQKTDGTPGALIFFSLLGEPKYIQNLQQLILQLQQLKGFASGNSHIDYLTLKKRVQVCVVSIPNIQKLLDKYFHLYEKWSLHRMNWFTERNRTGGSADAYTNCPLCYHDLLDSPNSEIRNQTLHLLKDTVEKDHQKKTLAMSKSMQSLSNTNNSSANNLQSSSPIIHGTINPKRSASPGGNSRNQLIKGRTLELNPVIRHSTPNL